MLFFNDTASAEIYTLSLHDALPISARPTSQAVGPTSWKALCQAQPLVAMRVTLRKAISSSERARRRPPPSTGRSEEHTSELQSRQYLVCRLLLEKKTNPCQTPISSF